MNEYIKLRTLIKEAKETLDSSDYEEFCNEAIDLFEEEIGIHSEYPDDWEPDDFDDDF